MAPDPHSAASPGEPSSPVGPGSFSFEEMLPSCSDCHICHDRRMKAFERSGLPFSFRFLLVQDPLPPTVIFQILS